MPTRDELNEQAEALGIKVDNRWSDDTLATKITEATTPQPKPKQTIKAPSDEWPKRIGGGLVWQLEDGTVVYPGQPWPVETRG